MKINHVAENQDGTKVTFQGVVEGPELAFILEYGINHLLREGAIPFIHKDSVEDTALIMDEPELEQ